MIYLLRKIAHPKMNRVLKITAKWPFLSSVIVSQWASPLWMTWISRQTRWIQRSSGFPTILRCSDRDQTAHLSFSLSGTTSATTTAQSNDGRWCLSNQIQSSSAKDDTPSRAQTNINPTWTLSPISLSLPPPPSLPHSSRTLFLKIIYRSTSCWPPFNCKSISKLFTTLTL